MILNTYFDHIYVITLQRAQDRQQQIRTDLEGLNYSFFYGADKAEFNIDTLKQSGVYDEAMAKKEHRYNKAMRDGQIGCSWSHRMVYEDMLAKGYKKVLILEDDVQLLAESLPAFEKAIAELPADWELLYLDHAKNESRKPLKQTWYHVQHFFGGLKWSHRIISNLYAKPYSTHLRTAGFHDYTDAYAITQSGAGKLLQMQTPIHYVADDLLAKACTRGVVKGFVLQQKVFSQYSQGSTDAQSFVNA